jgi:predicted O-methyltransferase YrrM
MDLFAEEFDSQKKIRESLRQDGKLGINVSAVEGSLLGFLLQLIQAQTVVEIGTLYGYSTTWIARSLSDRGRVISIEFNPENFEKASDLIENSTFKDRIELLQGDAVQVLKTLRGPFDACFIDANKGGYMEYLKWAMENVRPGGLIVGDNTFLFGHVYGADKPWVDMNSGPIETMKLFNETLAQSKNFRAVMIPTSEGMTVAQRLS